jgi:hypothetical protein
MWRATLNVLRRESLESLFAHAVAVEPYTCQLPSGKEVTLRRLHVRFGRASPEYLKPATLARTYTSKPLVTFNGDAMFGELAIVRWLEVDGWEAVWLDTFHARKVWRAMPTKSAPIRLPPSQQALYDRLVEANGGKASGSFDVMAWRNGQHIFIEYKGPRDRPNRNESRWIEAALTVGISTHDLFIVSAA